MAEPNYEPTPEQIAAACREIQSKWTNSQRMERIRSDWRPTFTRADGHVEHIASDIYSEHHAAHEVLDLASC